MKKLRSRRGETLTETLIAILIVAIAATALATRTATVARLNDKTNTVMTEFYAELSAAESGEAVTSYGQVTIRSDRWLPIHIDADYTTAGAFSSYRRAGDAP